MKIQKLECKLVNEAATLLGTRSPSGAEGDNYTEEVLLGFCSLQQTHSSAPDLTHYTTAFKVWINIVARKWCLKSHRYQLLQLHFRDEKMGGFSSMPQW